MTDITDTLFIIFLLGHHVRCHTLPDDVIARVFVCACAIERASGSANLIIMVYLFFLGGYKMV